MRNDARLPRQFNHDCRDKLLLAIYKNPKASNKYHFIKREKAPYSLIKKVQSNSIVTFPDDIITEGRGIPTITSFFVVCLLAQSLFP